MVFPEHSPEKSASMFTDVPSTTVPLSDHRQFEAVQGGGDLHADAELSHPYVHEDPSQLYPSEEHFLRVFPSHCFSPGVHILGFGLHVAVELSQPYSHVPTVDHE
jgi:hypothetical protein